MATTTENLGLTLPAGTDKAEISVLNENFQEIDDFAGQATSDIQQAQETANAAAPQATTYTKTEVDTSLAGKANTSDLGAAIEELELMEGAGAEVATAFAITKAAALAYLMFNLFSPPCFAAIGAMNSEMKSSKWLWGGIAFQFGVGYTVSYLVYQIGTIVTTGSFGAGFIPGLMFVAVIVAVVVYLCINSEKRIKKEYALKGNTQKSKVNA